MTRPLAALLCSVVVLASCASEEHAAVAKAAARKVAEELASGNYETIWFKASSELQKAHSREEFATTLAVIPRPVAQGDRSPSHDPELRYLENLVYVQLYHRVKTSEAGTAEEILTFRIDGQLASLVRYDLALPTQRVSLASVMKCPQKSSRRSIVALFRAPPPPRTHCPDFRDDA